MNAALLGEGPTDRALLPLLRWLLGQSTASTCEIAWVDTNRIAGEGALAAKVARGLAANPCDLLFVHRDSDQQPPEWRYTEIAAAVGAQPYVAVVPIRMTEAWLLLDAAAIRAAAGRPSGAEDLALPPLSRMEALADPKRALREALISAHAATGRRAARFDPGAALYRVADLVEDWSPLRRLSAFQRLERDTRTAVEALGLPLRAVGD